MFNLDLVNYSWITLCTGKVNAFSTKDTKTMFRDLSDLCVLAGIPAFVSGA